MVQDELVRSEKQDVNIKSTMGFDYADYDLRHAVNSEKSTYHYEELECVQCGKKLKTVSWIAVYN